MNNKEELSQWLDILWGSEPSKVYLAYKDDPKNPKSFSVLKAQNWPEKRESIAQYIIGMSASGRDMYYTVSTFIDETVSKHKFVQKDKQDTDIPNVKGSRALFIDLDGNAAQALERLVAAGDVPRPSARIQSGGAGHEHWYWILDGLKSMQEFEPVNKKLAYFLDADVGCWNADRVLRPPFTTNFKPEYGEPLPVDFIEKNDSVYTLEDFDVLPEIRDSIVENVHLGKLPTKEEVLAKYTFKPDFVDLFNKVKPDGDRSSALVRVGYHGAEAGMPDEAIYVLLDDADKRWGKFVGRNDRERRLAQIIQKVRVKHPAPMTVTNMDEAPVQLVYTFNELLNSEFEFEWLIEGIIPKGSTCFLSAGSGIGKSRLSLQMALAMSTGTGFLGWPTPEKELKCFYLSLEMGGVELKEFIAMLSENADLSESVSKNFLLSPIGNPLVLGSEEGFNLLEMFIQEHRPDIMFIDAMGKLTLGELNQVESKNINNQLNYLKHKYGTTFLIIHHMRKGDNSNSDKRPTQSDIYGDQYIITDAAIVLTMWKEQNQANIELYPLKVRFGKGPDPIILDGKSGFKFIVHEKLEGGDDSDNSGFGLSL